VARENPLELLDRQYARVRDKDGAAFFVELRRFVELIESQAQLTQTLDELRAEAAATEQAFREHDARLVPDLVELRQELVRLAPEADDSTMTRPQQEILTPVPAWNFSLANFDQVATDGPDHVIQRTGYDDSRSGMLVAILQNKLRRLQWEDHSTPGVPRASPEPAA
jgi:hypothetical protein